MIALVILVLAAFNLGVLLMACCSIAHDTDATAFDAPVQEEH